MYEGLFFKICGQIIVLEMSEYADSLLAYKADIEHKGLIDWAYFILFPSG